MLFSNFLNVFLDSAPWLLLGLFLAGMLKMFIPMQWMQKQLGGHGIKSTIKAAMLGAPLPLCSCGVIPAAIGLRRAGASKASTISFLISTPETGVDSIGVSYVLLGPFMAIARPLAAITSAIFAGILVGKDEEIDKQATSSMVTKKERNPSQCCSASHKPSEKDTQSTAHGSCQSSETDIAYELKDTSVLYRIKKGLHFACTDLIKDTTIWLLIGLFFAAIVQTYVPTDLMTEWGDGILAMLFMVLISIPMYICATASTPIAAGLLLAGVSPGAVLVFMLAGPATNIATIGMVNKEMGKRALGAYLFGVMSVALLSGILVNYLVDNFAFEIVPQVGIEKDLLALPIVYTSGIVLAILMAKVLFDMLPSQNKTKNNGCCSS